jgi:hypothetical protein|tara:strand:+ start:153 stop:560 length:408 start_codon:yes stop_codon:yes gene_type:complete
MTFSKEAIRLINDTDYRDSVYKDTYGWEDLGRSLTTVDLQKTYWIMINMYGDEENKNKFLEYMMAYDKFIPSDQIVIAAFYTYVFFDPKITKIEDGKPNIYRPDLFEEYLRRTKEIAGYITYFREGNAEQKIKNK